MSRVHLLTPCHLLIPKGLALFLPKPVKNSLFLMQGTLLNCGTFLKTHNHNILNLT